MTTPADSDPRTYPAAPLLGVSASVFRDGKVLIARRAGPPLAGLWSLPGGLVEPGETMVDAAAREVFEETGVSAEIGGIADVIEIILNDDEGAVERHYVILSFAARWLAGDGETSAEVSEIAWLRPDELGGLEMTEGTEAVIARAAALLEADDDAE
jgi:8-oxo-dGTP diphosphatase